MGRVTLRSATCCCITRSGARERTKDVTHSARSAAAAIFPSTASLTAVFADR